MIVNISECPNKLFFNYRDEEGEAFSLRVPEMVKLCSHIARGRCKAGSGFVLIDSTNFRVLQFVKKTYRMDVLAEKYRKV